MTNTLSMQAAAHGSFPAFAGHSGFITALAGCGFDIQAAIAGGTGKPDRPHPDLAARAGLGGGLFEVFVPPVELPGYRRTATGFEVDYPPRLDRHHALDRTLAGIAALLRLQRAPESCVRLVRTVEELDAAQAAGAFAAVLHLADADAIDTGLTALPVLHAAGLRSLAITWSRRNALASLAKAGHDSDTLAAIFHLNWMRIFRATWRQEPDHAHRSLAPAKLTS